MSEMTSRHGKRIKHIQRSQLKESELLPDKINYGWHESKADPLTAVELIILWRLGYIRPSLLVVMLNTLPLVAVVAASIVGVLLHDYILFIPLVVSMAILILVMAPMLRESWRTHLSIGTIASLKSKDRALQINMALVAVAIVAVLLVFVLIDAGTFEDGARIEITVGNLDGWAAWSYVVFVDGARVKSGTLEPDESTTFKYVHRWSFPEPTNVTIRVGWDLFDSEQPFLWSQETVMVAHGEFYRVSLYF